MEQLEITLLDLKSFGHIEEMVNTSNIRKIKIRLLEDVSKDFSKIVINNIIEGFVFNAQV